MNTVVTQPQQKRVDPRALRNFNRKAIDTSLKGIKNWLAASLCGLSLFLVCTANVGASPVIITSNCSNTNVSCTLDELLRGGSFSANGVKFSHWGRRTNQISNGSYVFNAANIIVTPFGSNDSAPGSTVGFQINPIDLTGSWLGTLQSGEWDVFFAGIKSDIEVNEGSPIGATDLRVRFGVDGDLASIENLLLESKNHLLLPNSSDYIALNEAICASSGASCLNAQGVGVAASNVAFGPKFALDSYIETYMGIAASSTPVTTQTDFRMLGLTASYTRVLPEPSTMSLLAIALLALRLRRRPARA